MAAVRLDDFITAHRDELIRRCRTKVTARPAPIPGDADLLHGIPVFLDQLIEEVRQTGSQDAAIRDRAAAHGGTLWRLGLSVAGVVHGYGDVCQAVTELAMDLGAQLAAEDFHTLNRCLDDAIASALTTYAYEQDGSRSGESQQLRILINTALRAFDVLKTGTVGLNSSTADLLDQSLHRIRTVVIGSPPEASVTAPRPDAINQSSH